jgi:putative phosphoesterase
MTHARRARIGCVSDTHGFLDPRAFAALDGVERILHAGDVGDEAILIELAAIAPVSAVRGNVDATRLPEWIVEEIAGVRVGMTHIALGDGGVLLPQVAARAAAERLDLLVFGHTHAAFEGRHGAMRLFNPGSVGQPRFRLKPSLGIVTIGGGASEIVTEILPLV